MPRGPRVTYPHAVFHVINRFVDKHPFFRNASDREAFLDAYFEAAGTFGILTYAYAIMPNHFHILLETPTGEISRFLQRFLTRAIQSLNRKLGRRGHLLEARSKTLIVQTDSYFETAWAYVVSNRLRAGLTRSLFGDPWNSVQELLNPGRSRLARRELWWHLFGRELTRDNLGDELAECRKLIRSLSPSRVQDRFEEGHRGAFLGDEGFRRNVLDRVERRKGSGEGIRRTTDREVSAVTWKQILDAARTVVSASGVDHGRCEPGLLALQLTRYVAFTRHRWSIDRIRESEGGRGAAHSRYTMSIRRVRESPARRSLAQLIMERLDGLRCVTVSECPPMRPKGVSECPPREEKSVGASRGGVYDSHPNSTRIRGGTMNRKAAEFVQKVVERNPGEPEFHQAVQEVVDSVMPYMEENPKYLKARILERMVEPERVIMFRVPWMNDKGEVQVNRGYRIEMNSAIGPYKGGLRFHPSVNLGILKFLAFEQVFKNSLTTLPMGGGKGGSDFDPKGKSDNEVMRFCQSFMTELQRHIGPDTDVPAGDIGVGGREIGFMYGQYKRLRNEFTGVLTGKSLGWGGSLIRPEATGYGCVYYVQEMLKTRGDSLKGKICTVSGSGNVAQYTVEKLLHLGAKPVTLSDSDGSIYDEDGISEQKLQWAMELKNVRRGRIKEYADKFNAKYIPGKKPWGVKCDIAFPSATQNEIDGNDAKTLLKNGCFAIGEGANMPSTPEAIKAFQTARILYSPGKAANAGGVATSGLEMSQNSMRLSWSREEVDQKLHQIMVNIHESCVRYGKSGNYIDYVKGANIAGFVKVADAMIDQGLV